MNMPPVGAKPVMPPVPQKPPVPGTGGSGYPDAANIPEAQESEPGSKIGENPVIGALSTIKLFLASLQKANDPKAEGVKRGLLGILEALGGGAAPGKPEGPAGNMAFNPFEPPAEDTQAKQIS